MASGTIRCFISRRFERRLPNLVPKKRRITVTGARRFANFLNGATTPQKVDAGDRKHSSSPAARKAQNGGQCDLLVEKTPKDSPLFKQTLLVRDLAKAVGSELGQLQCDLARLRTTTGLDSKTSVA